MCVGRRKGKYWELVFRTGSLFDRGKKGKRRGNEEPRFVSEPQNLIPPLFDEKKKYTVVHIFHTNTN